MAARLRDEAHFSPPVSFLLSTLPKGYARAVRVLRRALPCASEEYLVEALLSMREECGGTLTGVPLPILIRRVAATAPAAREEGKLAPVQCVVYRKDTPQNEECGICLEDLSLEVTALEPCGHKFHTDCIRTWLKEKSDCPFCRNFATLRDEYPDLE